MKTENFKRIKFKDHHFEVLILPFTTENGLEFIRIVLKDITSFVRLEKELLKRNKELIIISTLSNSFISSENMELALDDLLEKVLLITDFTAGWLMLKENACFKVKAGRGISQEFKKSIEEGELEPLCNKVADQGEPLYFVDTSDTLAIKLFQKEGISVLTALPLISTQKTMGMLFLSSSDRSSEILDFDVAALLSLVGNHVSLIIDKIRLFQETERLSITDSLTGLYNRRHFYKHLALETARSRRYQSAFSLILFDIDNFKTINDTYGHQVGDEVLQKLSDILRHICRETDIIVRYGGEEFIIILPNTSEEETVSLAGRIKNTVEETVFESNSEKISFTLSGGIASYPINASTAKALLNAADTALYEAKSSGKNKILCYTGKIDEKNIQQTSEP